MKTAKVALVSCDNYEPSRVDAALREAVSLLPDFSTAVTSAKQVLLKINLTDIKQQMEVVATHPQVVRSVAKLLKETGARVLIGDSNESGWRMWRQIRKRFVQNMRGAFKGKKFDEIKDLYLSVRNLMTFSDLQKMEIPGHGAPNVTFDELSAEDFFSYYGPAGMTAVAEETGASLSYFDVEESLEAVSTTGYFVDKIEIAKAVVESDLVISVPKFKTHEEMVITGAIKNFFGIIPTTIRSTLHGTSIMTGSMGEMLVDIFSMITPPPFVITDAILGMEGQGPLRGEGRTMGLIMASTDCVAHDAVMAKLMGIDPMDVPVVRIAHEAGLGQGNLKDIEILGIPLDVACKPDWKVNLKQK
jgi:uncharacterized protein (DUF362 family)